ncbi:MAG: MarR family transcriptional regulator, partial [Spirochaetales bacterium]|nr:MarR family transcriptional regulator [Spirochaetales bacterium]
MEEDKSIGSYVARLFNQSHSYMKRELKPYNLGPMQLRIIQVLSGDENIKQQELADRLNVDKTSLARTIRKLEENGYILRLKNESDTRAYRISLTGKAKAIEE